MLGATITQEGRTGALVARGAALVGGGVPLSGSGWSFDAQWNESPQAHEPVALGLSIVKPCFSIVSTKSMLAPPR